MAEKRATMTPEQRMKEAWARGLREIGAYATGTAIDAVTKHGAEAIRTAVEDEKKLLMAWCLSVAAAFEASHGDPNEGSVWALRNVADEIAKGGYLEWAKRAGWRVSAAAEARDA